LLPEIALVPLSTVFEIFVEGIRHAIYHAGFEVFGL
jgi:hypothetical protein